MSLRLFMDVHVQRSITLGLRLRGIDALTAQEDGSARLSDTDLLTRSTELNRVLFTRDEDLLVEAANRTADGRAFAGIVFAHQQRVTIGQCVRDLELLATVFDAPDFARHVEFLPLH